MKNPFEGKHILVAGETCLDINLRGQATRLCPEAPVPLLLNPQYTYSLGMSANVVANILALGGEAGLITCLGSDEEGTQVKELLAEGPRLMFAAVTEEARPTITKLRIAAPSQPIVRIDREESEPISEETAAQFIALLVSSIPSYDGLIIQDYGKGLWTPIALRAAMKTALDHGKPVFVDPFGGQYPGHYRGATLIKANASEAKSLTGFSDSKQQVECLLNYATEMAAVTRGAEGMSVGYEGAPVFDVKPLPITEVDVTGAGDTVIAALALALCNGYTLLEAAALANGAAAVVVGKKGTATATWEETRLMLGGDK